MTRDEHVQYWLDLADYDLDTAIDVAVIVPTSVILQQKTLKQYNYGKRKRDDDSQGVAEVSRRAGV